jgi:hypothetical protein
MMPDAFGPMKEFWQTGWRSTESTAERIDFDKSFEQVRAIQDLGDLRTVVLTSDTWQGLDDNAVAQQTWIRFHDDYVALSSNAEQRVVPDSDHFIQRSAPSVVAEAIKEVVGQLQ